jgi:methyl-accepting chemotaxis protein
MFKKDFRRRTRVVNKSLQYKFLAMILIYSAALVLFLALSLFVPDIVQMQDQGVDLDLRAAAAERLLTKHAWVWPAVFVLIGIIATHSFRTFWRVVGPLYRFQVVFRQVSDGDLSYPVKLRDGDYLHEEAKVLNKMLLTLVEKAEAIKRSGEEALRSVKDLEKKIAAESNRGETHSSMFKEQRRHLEELLETARYFENQKVRREEPGSEQTTPDKPKTDLE